MVGLMGVVGLMGGGRGVRGLLGGSEGGIEGSMGQE